MANKMNWALIGFCPQEEIKAKTYWARQVQFGLLTRYRDQTATLLNGMDTLLDDAFLDINQLANKILILKQVHTPNLDKKDLFGIKIKKCWKKKSI